LNYEIIVFDIIIHIHSRSDADHIQEGFQAASEAIINPLPSSL